jgi:hypothetical protein
VWIAFYADRDLPHVAALEHQCRLLHNDRDFTPIAKHFALKMVKT